MRYVILSLLLSTVAACTNSDECKPEEWYEQDYSDFEGLWEVDRSMSVLRNDTLSLMETNQYKMRVEIDGSGLIIRENFNQTIQLAYSPAAQKISVISYIDTTLSGKDHRQLRSENYDIVKISEDEMFWTDVDRTSYQGVNQLLTWELNFFRIE